MSCCRRHVKPLVSMLSGREVSKVNTSTLPSFRLSIIRPSLFQVLSIHCSHKYSLTCLKMDAVRMVDKLGHTPAYRLFPGISLVHSNYSSVAALPPTVVALLAEGNVTALDEFLAGRVTEYLNSLTLAVKVLDAGTVSNARRLSEEILAGRYNSDQQIGNSHSLIVKCICEE